MIQRKQTLFLLLAVIASVICLCLPIAAFEPKGMGINPIMYNFGIYDGKGGVDFVVFALSVILALTSTIGLFTIFKYNNRILQARLCVFNILLLIGWYLVFAFFVMFDVIKSVADMTLHVKFAVCLPFISIVLFIMARRGVVADEKLVRAADRIR